MKCLIKNLSNDFNTINKLDDNCIDNQKLYSSFNAITQDSQTQLEKMIENENKINITAQIAETKEKKFMKLKIPRKKTSIMEVDFEEEEKTSLEVTRNNSIKQLNDEQRSLLLCSIRGDREAFMNKINSFLQNNNDLNFKDEKGWTCLHYATEDGNYKIVMSLIKLNCNVNAKNLKKQTPLHLAVINGYFDITKILIENGGDIYLSDEECNNCFHLCALYNHLEITKYLIEQKTYVNIKNLYGKSALDLAQNDKMKKILMFNSRSRVNILSSEENQCKQDINNCIKKSLTLGDEKKDKIFIPKHSTKSNITNKTIKEAPVKLDAKIKNNKNSGISPSKNNKSKQQNIIKFEFKDKPLLVNKISNKLPKKQEDNISNIDISNKNQNKAIHITNNYLFVNLTKKDDSKINKCLSTNLSTKKQKELLMFKFPGANKITINTQNSNSSKSISRSQSTNKESLFVNNFSKQYFNNINMKNEIELLKNNLTENDNKIENNSYINKNELNTNIAEIEYINLAVEKDTGNNGGMKNIKKSDHKSSLNNKKKNYERIKNTNPQISYVSNVSSLLKSNLSNNYNISQYTTEDHASCEKGKILSMQLSKLKIDKIISNYKNNNTTLNMSLFPNNNKKKISYKKSTRLRHKFNLISCKNEKKMASITKSLKNLIHINSQVNKTAGEYEEKKEATSKQKKEYFQLFTNVYCKQNSIAVKKNNIKLKTLNKNEIIPIFQREKNKSKFSNKFVKEDISLKGKKISFDKLEKYYSNNFSCASNSSLGEKNKTIDYDSIN